MFQNIMFGSLDTEPTNQAIDALNKIIRTEDSYISCAWPQAVKEYMAVTSSPGDKRDLRFLSSGDVQAFEACMMERVKLLKNATQGTDAPKNLAKLVSADSLSKEISGFKDYLQQKMQDLNGWTTPQFSSWYYETLWGSYSEHLRISGLIQQEGERRRKAKDTASTALQVQAKYALSTSSDYYSMAAPKYGPKLSQGEQKQLYDFFVDTLPEKWSIEDFLKVGKLIEGVASHADVATYYMVIPMTVTTRFFLGADGSPSDYMKRVKAFSDAGSQAALAFINAHGGQTVNVANVEQVASDCKNDAKCIADYYTRNPQGGGTVMSAPGERAETKFGLGAVVVVAAVGYLIFGGKNG